MWRMAVLMSCGKSRGFGSCGGRCGSRGFNYRCGSPALITSFTDFAFSVTLKNIATTVEVQAMGA